VLYVPFLPSVKGKRFDTTEPLLQGVVRYDVRHTQSLYNQGVSGLGQLPYGLLDLLSDLVQVLLREAKRTVIR